MRWFDAKGGAPVREFVFGVEREACDTHDFAVLGGVGRAGASDALGGDEYAQGVASGSFDAVSAAGFAAFERFDERLREAAEEGFQAGLQQGLRQATAVAEAHLQQTFEARWLELLERLVALERNTAKQLGKSAVGLARALAQKLLARELSADTDWLLETVEGALRSAVGFRHITVELNPAMVKVLAPRLAALAALTPDEATVELAANPSLDAGSCRLVAAEGQIDCLLDERLDHLVAVVESHLLHDPTWLAGDTSAEEAP